MADGSRKPWNPYLAGGLTGAAITLSYLVSDTSFGATPFYAWLGKAAWMLLGGRSLLSMDYLGRWELRLGWMQMFGFGIPLGALLAAVLFREFKWQAVPPLWRARFGPAWHLRAVCAFIGGAIGMLGVRLAGGCPSGLGLSGMIELSLGGYVGMAAFFAGGALMAWLLYGKWQGNSGEAQ